MFQHMERTFHDIDGEVIKQDSGFMHVPLDRHGIRHIQPHMPVLKNMKPAQCDGVYCGWPFYFPMQAHIK